ncbi:MAG TPA: hypothetical protein VFR24_27360 [Candidatus Angelobacter sp.]|nr:hypothetical protein [Candidatus Angelobacter sp.]
MFEDPSSPQAISRALLGPQYAMALPPGEGSDIPGADAPGLFQQPFGIGSAGPGKAIPFQMTRAIGTNPKVEEFIKRAPAANTNDNLTQRLQEGRSDIHSSELMGPKLVKDPVTGRWNRQEVLDYWKSQNPDLSGYAKALNAQKRGVSVMETPIAKGNSTPVPMTQILPKTVKDFINAANSSPNPLPSSTDQLRSWMQELGVPDPIIK